MSADPYKSGAFKHICDMEDPLRTVREILRSLTMIAETMDEDRGSVVQCLAWLGVEQCKAIEQLRGELFHLAHPNRDAFEKERQPT